MENTNDMEPVLPRKLEEGEFYCWICREFVKVKDSEAHAKDHRQRGRVI